MSQCRHIIVTTGEQCKNDSFIGPVEGYMCRSEFCSRHEPEVVAGRKRERAVRAMKRRATEARAHNAFVKNRSERLFPVDIPPEIVAAAEAVDMYFKQKGVLNWKLGPCAARRICDAAEADCVRMSTILLAIQEASAGYIE